MAKRSSIPDGPLTQERLHDLIRYDPDTGLFTNKVARSNCPVGRVLGSKNKILGYLIIVVDGKYYYAHRLAWFYISGEWPEKGIEIDHENRNKHDNRWVNLRRATKSEQQQNCVRKNRTGFKGVYLLRRGKYVARIYHEGVVVRLGTFETAADAGAAYAGAKARFHPFQPTVPVAA